MLSEGGVILTTHPSLRGLHYLKTPHPHILKKRGMTMLSQRSITLSSLFAYSSFILGFGLLALAQLLGSDDLARWGIAGICVACTYSIHRSMAARDDRLRQAFEYGREHERTQNLAAVR